VATQTLEFNATSGLAITAKLFALESDTLAASVAAVERTNDKGRYRAAFTDQPAGAYRLNGFVGANGGFANEVFDLLLTTDVFLPRSEQLSSGLEILAKLDAIKGPGDSSWSIEVTTTTGAPINGCDCWVATDVNGNNVITDIQRTNAVGIVEFLLDPGTYYLWRQKTGYTFSNPQTIVVS